MDIALLLIVGLTAGILSGLLGIGGGILVVPALVLVFGLSQHAAQGTTLAMMIPPIGLLAAWTYYRHGNVEIGAAALICLGFFFGGLIGAKFAALIDATLLRKLFGIVMLIVAARMIIDK